MLRKEVIRNCPGPTYFVEVVGPHMFIYGAVFGQYVYVDRLTSPIWLVVQPENSSAMAKIARTLKALKISIHSLMNYYEHIKISKQPRFPFFQSLEEGEGITYVKEIKMHVFRAT